MVLRLTETLNKILCQQNRSFVVQKCVGICHHTVTIKNQRVLCKTVLSQKTVSDKTFKTVKKVFSSEAIITDSILKTLHMDELNVTGLETRYKSTSLTHARTCQKHSMRVFSDSHLSFVRLLSLNGNFHNNMLLNNSNTLIFHFFW